ncbi:MAG: YgfZ/GcvT domain-containing protein [Gammaproteobacteria bacterium]
MNITWKKFLVAAGANFDQDYVVDFGNPVRERLVINAGNIIADLSHQGLIAVQGQDAQSFLHSQFTNDMKRVDTATSQLSGYCNPKGRLLAIFRVYQIDDGYILSLPMDMVESIISRLQKFILMARVRVHDASHTMAHIGLSGPQGDIKLKEITGATPERINAVVQIEGLTIARIPGPSPRFEIFGSFDAVETLWSKLDVHAAPVGRDAWDLLDIQQGIPSIVMETSEMFVPQMVNLELIEGLSFKKGCYPGQEIVARMQYRGKTKRRMFRAHITQDSDYSPAPGTQIYAPDQTEQSIGNLVIARRSPDDGYNLLIVVAIEYATTKNLRFYGKDGPAITLKQLPYELPSE